MNLDLDGADLAFRDRAAAWLAANVPAEPLPSMNTEAGFAAHRRWEARLAADRWSVVSWPATYGGRDASPLQWLLFEEEYYAAGAPGRVGQNGIFLLGPALRAHGTAEQRRRYLPAIASGAQIWAQAWSEPGAGSDLAAVRAGAVRDPTGGGWRLHGQKTWSSRAAFADHGFGLFRTDPTARRRGGGHHGLSYFLFPLDAPGISLRPIAQLDGEPGFAEIFFDDVFVPDRDVLGAVGDGWRVAMSTAGDERGLSLRSPGRYLATADALLDLWLREGDHADTALRDRVADGWIGAQAYRLRAFNTVTRVAAGDTIDTAEGSVGKLHWSRLDITLHEAALDLLGPRGELAGDRAAGGGGWIAGYLFSLAGPIYAGSNQIQRDIVAERLLGLPRGRR